MDLGGHDGATPRRLAAAPDPAPAPDPPATAEELLVAVAGGDQAAFARLYDLVAARVHGLARRIVRDPARAEEVTQEVLLEVWRTAPRFDPARGSAGAWIFTIAHRRAVDRVRAEQASADRLTRHVPAGDGAGYDDVAEAAAARLEHQQVRRCLKRLTDLQREALTLAYYGGYSYREVADRLGAALPAVKTRMRDGLIRLRDCLGVSVG